MGRALLLTLTLPSKQNFYFYFGIRLPHHTACRGKAFSGTPGPCGVLSPGHRDVVPSLSPSQDRGSVLLISRLTNN